MEALALQASKTLETDLAGVDILQSSRGPLVLEVNTVPGSERIEAVCGIDTAAEIVAFLEQRVGSRSDSQGLGERLQ